ncbi:hypothetical protein SLA2020_262380 [Shorea laevis]
MRMIVVVFALFGVEKWRSWRSQGERVLIGGCSEWRCLNRVAWRSRHPTIAMTVTNGVVGRNKPKLDLNRRKSTETAPKTRAKDPLG